MKKREESERGNWRSPRARRLHRFMSRIKQTFNFSTFQKEKQQIRNQTTEYAHSISFLDRLIYLHQFVFPFSSTSARHIWFQKSRFVLSWHWLVLPIHSSIYLPRPPSLPPSLPPSQAILFTSYFCTKSSTIKSPKPPGCDACVCI